MRCRKFDLAEIPTRQDLEMLRDRVRQLETALKIAEDSARRAWALVGWGGTRREAGGCPAREIS